MRMHLALLAIVERLLPEERGGLVAVALVAALALALALLLPYNQALLRLLLPRFPSLVLIQRLLVVVVLLVLLVPEMA